MLHMSPSTILRQARREAGLTQAELALRVGVSQPEIARVERGNANPTWDTIVRVLRATGQQLELRPRPAQVELDLGQLRERLALTPAERLRLFQSSQRNLQRLVSRARRRGDD
jgi:transcriptional regulator with XRE-family HTH domain